MPDVLDVLLGERRVGTFANHAGDYNRFSFADEYLEDPRAPVLSQSFIGTNGSPLPAIPRTHRIAPPFFANLLPEEGGVLRSVIARQHGINRTRDFPFLRALGRDLPGAVVLRHAGGAVGRGRRLGARRRRSRPSGRCASRWPACSSSSARAWWRTG